MAEHISLRSFQENLTEKLRRAEEQDMPASKLGVSIAGRRWLVDLSEINEVMPLPPLLPVPLTKAWFRGVANVRGVLYGCTDLSSFFGQAPALPDAASRLLLVQPRLGVNAGLIVAATLGLRNPAQLRPHAVPAEPWARAVWLDGDGQSWQELDVAGLASDAAFLGIGVRDSGHWPFIDSATTG
jgi:twitching motility protein PilI